MKKRRKIISMYKKRSKNRNIKQVQHNGKCEIKINVKEKRRKILTINKL